MEIDIEGMRAAAARAERDRGDLRLRRAMVTIIGAEVLRLHGLNARSRLGALAELTIDCLGEVMRGDDWHLRPDR
jgi:hypothetical protein